MIEMYGHSNESIKRFEFDFSPFLRRLNSPFSPSVSFVFFVRKINGD